MNIKKNRGMLLLLAVTAVLITIFGITFKQEFFEILPLYVSLFVMLLQSKVNITAPLVGGLNSILYAAVYFSYGLYASAASALFLSFPMQIFTFIRWKKRPYGKTTILGKMGIGQRILTVAIFIVCWLLVSKTNNSEYALLDSAVAALGLISLILTALSYIEYTVTVILSNVVNLLLFISMLKTNPEQITYVTYAVYSLICGIKAFIYAQKIYIKQNEGNKEVIL